MTKRVVTLAAISSFAVACTMQQTPDAVSEREDDDRITPTDDEHLAHFTLQLPPGVCELGGGCPTALHAPVAAHLGARSLSVGVSERLLPGTYKLSLDGSDAGATVTLLPGQNRTFTLAVGTLACTPAPLPAVPSKDFGINVFLSNGTCPKVASVGGTWNQSWGPIFLCSRMGFCTDYLPPSSMTNCDALPATPVSGFKLLNPNLEFPALVSTRAQLCKLLAARDCTALGVPAWRCPTLMQTDWASAPLAPGPNALLPLRYLTSAPATDRTLAEGQVAAFNLTLPVYGIVPSQWTTNVTFMSRRELPDAQGRDYGEASSGIVARYGECGSGYDFSRSSGTLSLRAFSASSCSYFLHVGGREQRLDQLHVNNVRIHRIDIDDVFVTREDGSTYTTAGTYELWFAGAKLIGPFATHSGLDVLPGAYEVVVSYATAEGAKTKRYPISF